MPGNRRLDASLPRPRRGRGNTGVHARPRYGARRVAWSHEVVRVTEEDAEDMEVLKSTLLSEQSQKTYCAFLVKFVYFVAERRPELLTSDLREKLDAVEKKDWKKCARKYIMTKPKPPTSVFDLDNIAEIFGLWLKSLRKKDGSYMSRSTYNSCRSAVVSLFSKYDKPSADFDRMASTVIRGLKVRRAEQAAHGDISVKRGKDPLSFESYCIISEFLIKKPDENGAFCHAVLTTMWNLMSRVGNAVKICKNHLEWVEDALCIFFAHEKTDQTQSKPGDPRHIYANPFQPAICPILSLGIYFIICDITRSGSPFIFPGSDQYSRFHKSLKERFADTELLGHCDGTFGTHSIRKGSATYASSGSTACPPYAAVALRAGWTMGNVSSVYIRFQAAGDQHVGRTVTGLNPSHESFAVLPPRFKPDYNPTQLLSILFSGFETATPELRKVLTMTTASVVYHEEWLRNNLPAEHPIFSSALFTTDFGVPFSDMVECHTWTPGDPFQATGIPPHISLLVNMTQLSESMQRMPERVTEAIERRLLERGPFLGNASADQVKSVMVDALKEVMNNHFRNVLIQPAAASPAETQIKLPPLFCHNGKYSRLPEDFRLPSGPLSLAWTRYFCWDTKNLLPPLRAVYGHELKRALASRFARYKRLMEMIVRQAQIQGVWKEPDPMNKKSALEALAAVDLSQIFPALSNQGRERRLIQLSWITFSNELYRKERHSEAPAAAAAADDDDDDDGHDDDDDGERTEEDDSSMGDDDDDDD